MKKFIPLLMLLPLVGSTACSSFQEDGRTSISGNIGTFLYKDENNYLAPDISDISVSFKINASFAIYFTNDGCSSCDEFAPIMYEYMHKSNMMIYKFDLAYNEEDINDFKKAYGERFFSKDAKGNYKVPTPSVCIVTPDSIDYVNFASYMQTENAFFNYMESKYKIGNVYYTHGDVFKTDFDNREFAYTYFDFDDTQLMSIYKTKLQNKVNKSNRTVIVSHFADDSLVHLKLTGRTKGLDYSRKEFIITRDTRDNVINEVL